MGNLRLVMVKRKRLLCDEQVGNRIFAWKVGISKTYEMGDDIKTDLD
jgi:hypothetical protein